MNKLENNLKLLLLLDKVNIEQNKDDIIITCKEYNYDDYKQIRLIVKDGEMSCQMCDLYDNSNDFEKIDFEQLKTLQEVVKILMEN